MTTPRKPKAITAAIRLLNKLYNEQRPPTDVEWERVVTQLRAADARTRLDPSKRKRT